MTPTGVNMTNVKQTNRANVLKLLYTNGPMSRTELADALKLTTPTLTFICNEFLQRGILIQMDKAVPQSAGRKRYPLAINATYKYVISISLHYTGHLFAVTDLMGEVICFRRVAAQDGMEPVAFFHDLALQCTDMIRQQQINPQSILGVGVCITGPVDHIQGIALQPFRIFNVSNVPIRELLEKELPFPVCVESNVCSFLIAEMLMGGAVGNDLMAVKWGPGVGSASAVNGAICKDSFFRSTEIGHTLHFRNSPCRCKCGRVGCLETEVGLARIAEKITELAKTNGKLQTALEHLGAPSIHNILDYLALDVAELLTFVDVCARELAIGVNNATQVFQPDQVLLCGVLFESEYVLERFLFHFREIDSASYRGNMFIRSYLETKLEYIGPTAIAIQSFLLNTGGETAFSNYNG